MAITDKYFPDQRTNRSTKTTPAFYVPTIEFCLGIRNVNDTSLLNANFNAALGILDENDYKKILNPLNTKDERFKRFPATLRNYDILMTIVRRYMGEYMKQNFQYSVYSVDPDVSLRFNNKLFEEVMNLATKAYVDIINAKTNGADPNQPAPEIPDFKVFFDDFKAKYMDEYAATGDRALKAIIEYTNSVELYYHAFYNYIMTGVVISYRDIRNGQIFKEIISPLDFTSLGQGRYIKDHDICKRKFKVSPNDLVNTFSDVFDEKTINALRNVFKNNKDLALGQSIQVEPQYFISLYDEIQYPTISSASSSKSVELKLSSGCIEGYHITFKTQVPVYYVQRIDNNSGTIYDVLIEDDNYELNPMLGDVSLQKDWILETWESYCFGDYGTRIISVPRPIAYQNKESNNIKGCSQPYNGFYELIHGSGYTFSIPTIILPFQVFRNIIFYTREKTIAKFKSDIFMMPKSLIGSNEEETFYRIDAAGLFVYDDSRDDTNYKAQQIRNVVTSVNNYIRELSDLANVIKEEAWEVVDMNSQRYGDIANSSGKGVTQEAIIRSSMGSVLIYTMFDKFLETDYTLDLNYSKVTLSDVSMLNIKDSSGTQTSVSFDSNKHCLAEYKMGVRNSIIDEAKRQELSKILFNMSQNGDGEAAAAGVYEDSVAGLKQLIGKFSQATRDFQRQLEADKNNAMLQVKQLEQQTEAAKQAGAEKLAMIHEDGENQRTALKLKIDYLDTLAKASAVADSNNEYVDWASNTLDQLSQFNDMKKHNDDVQVKREQMRSAEKIAKMNKN